MTTTTRRVVHPPRYVEDPLENEHGRKRRQEQFVREQLLYEQYLLELEADRIEAELQATQEDVESKQALYERAFTAHILASKSTAVTKVLSSYSAQLTAELDAAIAALKRAQADGRFAIGKLGEPLLAVKLASIKVTGVLGHARHLLNGGTPPTDRWESVTVNDVQQQAIAIRLAGELQTAMRIVDAAVEKAALEAESTFKAPK